MQLPISHEKITRPMASQTFSALDLLLQNSLPESFLWVVFGDDDYLRSVVLQKLRNQWLAEPEDQLNLCEFSGEEASWADVYRELVTVSMFTRSPRLVIIDRADSFVSSNRTDLEKWASQEVLQNVLVLVASSWPSTTRLAKLAAQKGAVVECSFARKKRPELAAWIRKWAKQQYNLSVGLDGAEFLLESVGMSFGLVDQELQKLAGLGQKNITVETVRAITGTWRTKSVWDILGAALQGDAATALHELHRLLESGETPLAVLGMMAATLRRFTLATHRYLHPGPGQLRIPLQAALLEAGVPSFAAKTEEERLRQLGRHRAAQLVHWLRQADAAMKGALATDPRMILERLLIVLAHPEGSRGDLSPV